jgi:hypothetical protein
MKGVGTASSIPLRIGSPLELIGMMVNSLLARFTIRMAEKWQEISSSSFPHQPGTIYYTTDGSDPRRSGGGISPSAIQFEGGVTMTKVVAEGDAVRVTIPTATDSPFRARLDFSLIQ